MAMTKVLLGAWGTAAVGSGECFHNSVQGYLDACGDATDVASDLVDGFWFTSAARFHEDPSECSKVWTCTYWGTCHSVELSGGNWTQPSGIAIDRSNGLTVYISEAGLDEFTPGGVKKCTSYLDGKLDCVQFGSNWDTPQRLDLDSEGNVLITNSHQYFAPSDESLNLKSSGVWKCSPSGDCVLVGGSDHWFSSNNYERDARSDSQGNVYVYGSHSAAHGGLAGFFEKCTSSETCEDFGPRTPDRPLQSLEFAVAPDDYVYIRDMSYESDIFIRCSPDGLCQDIAPCHGDLPFGILTFVNGFLHSFALNNGELELQKFHFPTDSLQV